MKDCIHSGKRQKWAIIIASCGVLALVAFTAQWRVISQVRGENSALRSTQELVTDESGKPASLTQEQEATSASSERGENTQNDQTELLRLRNEVRQLRERVAETKASGGSEQTKAMVTHDQNPWAQSNPALPQRVGLTSEWRNMEDFATNRYAQSLDRLVNASNYIYRFHALGDVAKMHFAFGRVEDAQAAATELLSLAEKYKAEHWSQGSGQAVHDGNVVLGRLAFDQGAIEDAKRYLLEAGNSSGSPTLGSFGPNTSLAQEMLQIGERDTVLEYFQRCAKFWHHEKLERWTREINAGIMPDFGANLFY